MPIGGISRRPDVLTVCPDEILQDILIRLPAESVLRCRAVCRSWRRLTSDPIFLVAHHRHQPTLHLISSFPSARDLSPDRIDAVDLQSGERWPCLRLTNSKVIDASCDGLLVIGSRIYNTTTRQRAPISRKEVVQNVVGLFRHQPSGEYRVLFWRSSSVPSYYCHNEYCVLTVGSDDDPRLIRAPAPVGTDAAVIQGQPMELDLIKAVGPNTLGAPVLLHGNMYFHWRKTKLWRGWLHNILVFDTVAESFWHMRPPPVNPRHIMRLFNMGGMLAASSSTDGVTELRIFGLQDYKTEVWSFQYRIKLPVMEIRRFQEQGDMLAKIVSEEGDVLVSCFGWLFHCDRKGNLVAKFRYDDDVPTVTPHVLKESLVQHAFFQED